MGFLIRPCTLADGMLLDKWEPPAGEFDHLQWLMGQHGIPGCRTFIGEWEKIPVAFGRMTLGADYEDIGWFTAPIWRRHGYALCLAYQMHGLASKPLRATIHTNNEASEHIASKLGMVPTLGGGKLYLGLRNWIEPTSSSGACA